MNRWVVVGALTLTGIGAQLGFAPGVGTADAAPSVSPFAGSFVGADPQGWYGSWGVTISAGGRITSSYSRADGEKGSISGKVSADGAYSFTVSKTYATDEVRQGRRWKVIYYTESYVSGGSMGSVDADIVGTDDTGRTFTWLRQ